MKFNPTMFRLFAIIAIGSGLTVMIVLSSGLDRDGDAKLEQPSASVSQSADTPDIQAQTKDPTARAAQRKNQPRRDADPVTMAQIKVWQNSNSTSDRIKAVLALRDMNTMAAVKLLTWFLDDVVDAVAIEAIDALTNIALNSDFDVEIFDALQEKALDQYYAFRNQAIVAAAMIGPDQAMLQIVSKVMQDGGEEAFNAATRAMSFIATADCVPHLKVVLEQSDDPMITKSAANTLMEINTPESIAIVTALLSGTTEQSQKLGAWALTRRENAENAALLSRAITSGTLQDGAIKLVACSPTAADVFNDIFENQAINNQEKANLLKLISNFTYFGSSKTRNEMAKTVSQLLDSSDPEIVAAAAEAVGKVQASEDQTAALEKSLSSDNFLVQEKALYAYAQYCTPATYKPLTALYWDNDEKIRRTAFFLSSAFLNSSDRPILEKATTHEDAFIAKQSKILLNNIFDE